MHTVNNSLRFGFPVRLRPSQRCPAVEAHTRLKEYQEMNEAMQAGLLAPYLLAHGSSLACVQAKNSDLVVANCELLHSVDALEQVHDVPMND